MAAMITETPSRIWRRIESVEDRDMPSLPSLPGFEDDSDRSLEIDSSGSERDNEHQSDNMLSGSAIHSTPAVSTSSRHSSRVTASSQRFASSLARSRPSLAGSHATSSSKNRSFSFDVSAIPSLPDMQPERGTYHFSEEEEEGDEGDEQSKSSVPDAYLPPNDAEEDEEEVDDMSLSDALESLSRSTSPVQQTPKGTRYFDMTVPLRSEPKPSPLDPYRNIAMRRPRSRARTPSLSRTTLSPASSPANSTPQSTRSHRSLAESPTGGPPMRSLRSPVESSPLAGISVPLPRSATNSPAVRPDRSDSLSVDFSDREPSVHSETQSMDITEAHISPIRDPQQDSEEAPADEREPTFSSDGDNTPYPTRYAPQTSPPVPPSANTSASHTLAFTPTPSFPRPRARFNLPQPANLLATPGQREPSDEVEEDPLTPHTRRKSFLLSIVNSTTRPRMKMPTPHPRNRIDLSTQRDLSTTVESTPGPSGSGLGSAINLFGGATPAPRPRMGRPSHPLAQGFTASASASASDSESDGHSQSPSAAGSNPRPSTIPKAKPALRRTSLGASPAYDGAMDRASFVSTASSHDLTTNIRANTSFDPAMGFGVGAQATGRFNAGKLNTYLHGLNRRLQEENEVLIERLKSLEGGGGDGEATSMGEGNLSTTSSRRQSGAFSRRSSGAGLGLGDVPEDIGGEGWMTEKAELEEMVEVYKDEIEKNVIERDEMEKSLETERVERARDQERSKERMAEVEKGVEGIIGDLETKLQDAEASGKQAQDASLRRVRELELQVDAFRAEKDLAMDRADKAERALSSGLELGGDLKEANLRISNLMSDMRNSNTQVREMEEDAARADEKIVELERDLGEARSVVKELERELNTKMDELDAESAKLKQVQEEMQTVSDELEGTKAYVSELEAANQDVGARADGLELELDAANGEIHHLKVEADDADQRIAALEVDVEQSSELARQMEEALDAAEVKMNTDDEQVGKLRGQVAAMERERDRERTMEASRRVSVGSVQAPDNNAEVEALEEELDDAHREIARLNTILNSSPVRRTMDKAKDMRIEMLEKENDALTERLKTWKANTSDFAGATPGRGGNTSGFSLGMGVSPAHRQAFSIHMRTPRTPGGPLKDLTWLHNATGDGEFTPLMTEIERLHHELDRANESVDDKLDKLEDAGLGVVSLTRKLEDARARIVSLEEEIARLARKEDRRARRLEKLRCRKCLTKVRVLDADESPLELSRSMASEPPTPPTRTSEALKSNLRSVNSQLTSMKRDWEQERQQLVQEKAVLQDVANQLNDRIRSAAEEAASAKMSEKTGQALRGDIQSDLDKAKRTIAELEGALAEERAQLRLFTVEQNRVSLERENVLAQLRRTETDMDEVKQQLQRFKKENHDMEKELRENANVEQKARLLENRVAENAGTIEQLRQERSLLANDHKALQRQFTEVSEHANRLRDEHASSQQSHDTRRHQLDLHLTEIEDLRRALSDQAEELVRAEADKKRVSSEVSRTVAALEADLRRVRKDAEAFGRDLKRLRSEKERVELNQRDDLAKAQRAKKQSDAQIRLLNEQVEAQKMKAFKYKDICEKHVCVMDEEQLGAIRLQHNKECKGLIVQIRYLKAKFTREATLRFDLVYQKHYLMALLARMEKSEQTIFSAISKIGFPVKPPPVVRPRRKLKSVAMMFVFMARIRRSSEEWQRQCESKEAVAAALQDVRKRRMARS